MKSSGGFEIYSNNHKKILTLHLSLKRKVIAVRWEKNNNLEIRLF